VDLNKLAAVVAALCLLAAAASAGVLLTMESQTPGQEGQAQQKIYLGGDRIRVEAENSGDFDVVIFRQDLGVFWIVDPEEKSYTELTRDDLEQLSTRLQQMTEMLKAQLQELPPEQREQIEQMMGSQGLKPVEPTFEKVASGETVGDWTADKYVGTLNGVKQVELWTADYRELGLKAEDFQVLEEMGKMFEAFSQDAAALFKVRTEAGEGHFSGLPVKTVNFSAGQPAGETVVQEVKKQDFKPALFEVPEGYKKETMSDKMQEE